MITVPVPLPCRKTCKKSFSTMDLQRWIFTIDMQNFQMVSTSSIPLYTQPPFGIRTIFVHIKNYGIHPSQNATWVTLTALSHILVSGSFFLVAARNDVLRCSAFIPNGPPAPTNRIFLTATAISLLLIVFLQYLTNCTRIGSGSPYNLY